MQRSVQDLSFRSVVERLGEMARDAQRTGHGHRAVLAHDDVERIRCREALREKCVVAAVDTGRARSRNHGMLQLGTDQFLELGDELVNAFGRKIDPEDLYRDQSIAIGIIRTKDRAQSTIADLVEHAKWTEGVRRRGAGSFSVQSRLL